MPRLYAEIKDEQRIKCPAPEPSECPEPEPPEITDEPYSDEFYAVLDRLDSSECASDNRLSEMLRRNMKKGYISKDDYSEHGYSSSVWFKDMELKTICSREKNTDTKTNTGVLCLTCGAPIQMNPNGKEKRFCSRHCYNKWWHANHTVRTAYNRICPVCGKAFTVRSNKCQKYCSADCYQAGRRAGGEDQRTGRRTVGDPRGENEQKGGGVLMRR